MKVIICLSADVEVEIDDKFKALLDSGINRDLEEELADYLFEKLPNSTVKLHEVGLNGVQDLNGDVLAEW